MKQATLTGKQVKKLLEVFEDTPSDQVQAVLESGLLADLRDANTATINRDEFRRVCGLESLDSTQSELLLEPIGTVTIPATAERFVVRDRFTVNTNPNAPVIINFLSDNFKEWFLNGQGKVEEPAGEQTLRYTRLLQLSVDGPIIAGLGGEARAETTLTEMFALMKKQGHSQNGALLTDGYANIFYVKDIAGLLRAVVVRWSDDGWYVGAHSVEYPRRWDVGYRVFSRNS